MKSSFDDHQYDRDKREQPKRRQPDKRDVFSSRSGKKRAGQQPGKAERRARRGSQGDRTAPEERPSSKPYVMNSRRHSDNFLKQKENIRQDVTTSSEKGDNRGNSGGSNNQPPQNRRRYAKYSRKAMMAVAVIVCLIAAYIITALYQVQIVNHDEMSANAAQQYFRKHVTQPVRGDIYDRNGRLIATTKFVYRVGITPKHTYSLRSGTEQRPKLETEDIGKKMASILNIDEADLLLNLRKVDQTYIQIAKDVPSEKADELQEFLDKERIGGVRLDAEPQRIYFNDNLASEVIGFATLDAGTLEGRLGLEYQFNSYLKGQAGFSYAARDNYLSSGAMPFSEVTERASRDGYDLHTTIDLNVQTILQEELANACETYHTKKYGMGIVMNVNTGEIYAMASYPYFKSSDPTAKPSIIGEDESFDPTREEDMRLLNEQVWRNRNISDLYEAGSTFKAITAAIGLEENVTDEQRVYNDAPIQVYDHTIHCWTGEGHGMETMQDAFSRSCNPVFVQIAQDIGTKTFYDYVRAFGFYDPTGVNLPGEAVNIFHKNPLPIDLATLSFGEQSSVTPLHLLKAFASLTNGGNLVRPKVVNSLTDKEGRTVKNFPTVVERQVISEQTSARMNFLLETMVKDATMKGSSEGYRVGGKTSTATDEATGENTISFVEVAPMERPEIISIMILQEPQIEYDHSRRIMISVMNMTNRVLEELGYERNYTAEDENRMSELIEIPDFTGRTVLDAKVQMAAESIQVVGGSDTISDSDNIVYQVPAAGTAVHRGSVIYVYGEAGIPDDPVRVPDFTGKNYSECMYDAAEAGVIVRFKGDLTGVAVSQNIAASVVSDNPDEGGQTIDPNNPDNDPESPEDGTNVTPPESAILDNMVQRGTIIEVTMSSESTGD